ncbi:MAG: GTP 3',8-cyclase MoaA [Pseudomonadota bacterium]
MTFISPMKDPAKSLDHPRSINYLRISVTDRCNLACRYCVPKDTLPMVDHHYVARYEEILRIIRIARDVGITKIRVTGGEPLVRKGLMGFMGEISKIHGIEDVSITTNGILLSQYLPEFSGAGIRRLNISLDTLRPDRFDYITGKPMFDRVWDAILSAHAIGLSPIKLNAVILKGINDDEIADLAALSVDYPFHIRFIEYMPMGNAGVSSRQRVLIPEIKQTIEARFGQLIPVPRRRHDGPATRFKINGAAGEIGFISPVSSHFCHQCNRLRLTAVGKLRPCLLHHQEYDILTPLRDGASDAQILGLIQEVILRKPETHSLSGTGHQRIESQMSTIGG